METTTEAVKRPAEEEAAAAAPEAKKQKVEEPAKPAAPLGSRPDPALVKKQIEYYFSDMNLKHDKFFHEKISKDQGGWLDVALLLSCNKVKAMKATQEDLLGSLASSELETKEEAGKAYVRRKDNAKPPPLEARPPLHSKRKNSNVHDGGVIFQVKGMPEDQTWLNLKEALKGKMPEGGQVWFVSSVSESGSCVVAVSPFERDAEVVATELQLSLGGKDLTIEVCYAEALQQALKMLPKGIKERREKSAKTRQKARNRAIQLGGQKFVNVNTLRGKVKEILGSRTDGEALKEGGPDYVLIRAIMDYHPAKDRKTAGMTGIKVDVSEHGSSRCFWIVREDGQKGEDFSIKKCLDEIEKNPPYVEVAPPVAKAAATASPPAGAKDDTAGQSPKKEEQTGAEQSPKKTELKAEEKKEKSEVKKEESPPEEKKA